ncbi:glycine betaine ABC transporter substrate-binding protein [Cumulibacter soli]|uniref:glycine betaine ABC transporter substrate-binding protein n=1 Tax=Cumulibacter soli TaxID=2546344 RepID=UPI00106805BC|nr:glycine betaine ABC transporter substrate-binding protein [Cumulibacter soli]
MKKLSLAAIATATALVLAGCGASNEGGGGDDEGDGGSSADSKWADCTVGSDAAEVGDPSEDADQEVSMIAFNGWDESFATTYLLANVLEADGYTVDIQALDAGPGFTTLAAGEADLLTDVWLPVTHADYVSKDEENFESLGCWYDSATLNIAVNADSPAQTIGDLKDMADEYNNELVGIEAGAGETQLVESTVIPGYGLEDLNFTTSSTSAMLAAIQNAENNGTNVAVTLWHPHWAYTAHDLRDLEDPDGLMGGAEFIYTFAADGFGEDHPYVAQLVKNFTLDDDQLGEIEDLMVNKYDNKQPEKAVAEWLEANPDYIDDLKAGALV